MGWRVVTHARGTRSAAVTIGKGLMLAAVVPALAACGLQQDLSQRPNSGAPPSQAPAIAASTTLTGHSFEWSSVRGHPVVVDFWASWCAPCRAEQKDLNALFSKYAARGAVFLGVDMRDDNAAARAYVTDFRVPYQSVADPDEQISSLYNIAAPPTLVVIDASGRIVDRFLGTLVGVSADLDRLT